MTHHRRKPKETTELRRISDGSPVPLKQDAGELYFHPSAEFVVVNNYGSVPDELRRTRDGSLVVALDAPLSEAYFSPNAQLRSFIVSYYGAPGEVRNLDDGSLITPLTDVVSRIGFSLDQEASRFVVGYKSVPDELRRSSDGDLIATLSGRGRDPLFSPDGAHFIARYTGLRDELRRAHDGRVVVADLESVNGVDFSPDSRHLALDYGSDLPGELRRTADGAVVANLLHPLASAHFDPRPVAETFFANYFKQPGELRRIADGGVVWSPDENETVDLSPNHAYLIVGNAQGPGELRRFTDGSSVQTLSDVVDRLYFSLSATSYVVNYSSGVRALVVPAELRRADTGEIIATLMGSVADIRFAPGAEASFFVTDYDIGKDALQRTHDGSTIAMLSGEVASSLSDSTLSGCKSTDSNQLRLSNSSNRPGYSPHPINAFDLLPRIFASNG